MLTPTGAIVLTATNPFASYLVLNHLDMFKYEWIWEKDNGSNFVQVKHQPFKVHEQILIFGKAPTTYNKKQIYMNYNPQFTYSKPYSVIRDGSDVTNLVGFKGRTNTSNKDGKRYPRSVQKVNLERGLHPTQKPTSLFKYLIKTYMPNNGTVVNICAGCGTTAISYIQANIEDEGTRKYIINDNGVCENKKSKYYNVSWSDISKNRINTYLDNIK